MVGGQAIDLACTPDPLAGSRRRSTPTAFALMHARKTGALIRAAAVAGAIMGGGGDDRRSPRSTPAAASSGSPSRSWTTSLTSRASPRPRKTAGQGRRSRQADLSRAVRPCASRADGDANASSAPRALAARLVWPIPGCWRIGRWIVNRSKLSRGARSASISSRRGRRSRAVARARASADPRRAGQRRRPRRSARPAHGATRTSRSRWLDPTTRTWAAADSSWRTRSTRSASMSPDEWRSTSARRRADSPTSCSQRGASRVVALDVGHDQLDWALRSDPRVVVLERFNARRLTPATCPSRRVRHRHHRRVVHLAAADPAGRAAAPAARRRRRRAGQAAIRGRTRRGRRGGSSATPRSMREWSTRSAPPRRGRIDAAERSTPSPITGTEGNVEFLLHLRAHDAMPSRRVGIVAKTRPRRRIRARLTSSAHGCARGGRGGVRNRHRGPGRTAARVRARRRATVCPTTSI